MAYDVKVSIDLAKPLGVLGFGIPLVLLENADSAVDYTEVSSLTDVKEAGFDATSAVYKAAQLMFAQNHAPKKIAVCAVTGAATTALLHPDRQRAVSRGRAGRRGGWPGGGQLHLQEPDPERH